MVNKTTGKTTTSMKAVLIAFIAALALTLCACSSGGNPANPSGAKSATAQTTIVGTWKSVNGTDHNPTFNADGSVNDGFSLSKIDSPTIGIDIAAWKIDSADTLILFDSLDYLDADMNVDKLIANGSERSANFVRVNDLSELEKYVDDNRKNIGGSGEPTGAYYLDNNKLVLCGLSEDFDLFSSSPIPICTIEMERVS